LPVTSKTLVRTSPHVLTNRRYHVPSHIQQHVDYITPGVKLFAPKGPAGRRDIEKRSYKLPPLLKDLGITIEALLAIPELLACDIAITPPCIKSMCFELRDKLIIC
jgi:tripeptidyl-peptidase-1